MWQRHGGEVLNQPRLARGADAIAPGLGIDTRVPRPRREIATGERYRGGARPQGGCDGGWRDERQGELAKLEGVGVLEENGRRLTRRRPRLRLRCHRAPGTLPPALGPMCTPPPSDALEPPLP